MANFDIVNYKVVNGIYSSKYNVIQELEKGGATVTNDEDYTALRAYGYCPKGE